MIAHRAYSTLRVAPPLGKTLDQFSSALTRSLFFRRNQPGANRKSHQARYVVDLQSAHQLQAVRLNCLDADPQQIRDLLCILSFCDKLQYFALPKCELLQFWIDISRL